MLRQLHRAFPLAIALVVELGVGCVAAEDTAPSISPQELELRLAQPEPPLLLDVRTPEEFRAGHIPGAINVPHEQVAGRTAELTAPNGVAVYCMKGPRARVAEQALLASGATGVVQLEGGFSAWQAAGLPVEP
jgi:rhodanese-related sulfurtransferase